MKSIKSSLLTVVMTVALAGFTTTLAIAQQTPHEHTGPGHSTSSEHAQSSPATKEFEAANAKMHENMAIRLTGDADVDFVKQMIPHHQGAIDMAKVVLKHGKDSQVRKLAEDIIKAQEAEIATMRDWLKKHGH